MSQVLNASTILLVLGVIQPASPGEVIGFLNELMPYPGAVPREAEIVKFLKEREKRGHVLRVNVQDGRRLYALTLAGHRYLSVAQRKVRDKLRFFLLRDAHRARFKSSDGGGPQGWSALRRL